MQTLITKTIIYLTKENTKTNLDEQACTKGYTKGAIHSPDVLYKLIHST